MTDKGTQGRVVGVDPLGVGPDGKLGFPDRNRINGSSDKTCDDVRMQASFADSQQMFLDLIGQANRASTSFYTLDAAGLRTETRPVTATPLEAMVEARNRERMPYSTRLDSIRTLGEATNGMAIVDTNNFAEGLRRAAADFNSYYLLGYTSTNGKPDGRYRKIKVTVKRPGVQVRAREGYLARRADDIPARSTSNGAAKPGPGGAAGANAMDAQLTAALGRLTPSRPDVPLVVSAAAGAVPGGTARSIRVTAELDPAVAATPEWAEGGEAQAIVRDAKGDTITSGKAAAAEGRADGGDRSTRRRGHGRRREGAGAGVRQRRAGALHGYHQRVARRHAGRLGRAAPEPPRTRRPASRGCRRRTRASAARSGCGSASASARKPAR